MQSNSLGRRCPVFGGNKDDLRIRHKREHFPDFLCKLVDRLVIFLNGIPFIYSDNNTLCRCSWAMPAILASCSVTPSVASITDHDHIRTLHSCHCTDNAVPLQLFLNFILAAKSRCINKNILMPAVGNCSVHSVPRSTCNV